MRNNYLRILMVFSLLLISILSCFLNIRLSIAYIDTTFHTEDIEFSYYQFIENNGQSYNISELEISLPSSSWNMSHFEANFTDISLNQEQISIEDNPTDFYTIQKFQPLLAVQINITEPTIIYSVDIYAQEVDPSINPLYVQINGYDNPTQKPNNTIIYSPVELNISSEIGWHRQTFSNPSTLNPGYYSLIIDGLGIGNAPQPLYRWFNNIENATNPDLMIWTNNGVSWSSGIKNQTFLHRFIQKTTKIINPEDLNMQLDLNGDSYAISNGLSPGSGNVTITDINFSPLESMLHLPIRSNKTVELLFNCSYHIKLKNLYSFSGSLLIDYKTQNIWNASFIVDKILMNNSITYYYPSNWQNISIFQNDLDITSQTIFNYIENSFSINDSTLIDNGEIRIEANSLKFDFNLDVRSSEFSLGQELKFSIENPPAPGNYTVLLYDSLGYVIDDSIQLISIPSDANLYTYLIPENAKEGEYNGFVYFFDGFNAGIEVVSFNVRIPIIITFFIILISSVVGLTAVASSYVLIKKHKKKAKAKKKAIHDKINDIINLRHIMVSEKKSSLNVYEQTFSAKTIDTTLISGFLSAIRSFGIELTNTEDATQTIKLEYKNSKILMAEFKDFRIVLIMNELPSPAFLESIKKLSHEIETRYARLLESFKGNVQPFSGIERLLKTYLNTSFLYPLKIVKTGKTKINQLEKNMIGKALNIMKKRNLQYFYLTYLLDEKSWDSKDIEVLFSLLEKKVFQPFI